MTDIAKTSNAVPVAAPTVSIIVISYNTREMTLACLRSVHEQTSVPFELIVLDNASTDGSAEAIAEEFPELHLIASKDNLGFAAGNNEAIKVATGDYLLLLNPDTEVLDRAIDRLFDYTLAHPEAGITGGRTVFPDGALNIASCWMRITPWSAFCMATGLTAAFRGSSLFNPEGMGDWARDSVREVDIVVGCFLMIPRALWFELGGFDLKYFMYGEEADLCLRAKAMGYRPSITPDAEIVHLIGASSNKVANKLVLVAKARTTLIRDHWPSWQVPFGLSMVWLWGGLRRAVTGGLAGLQSGRFGAAAEKWRSVWSRRDDWLAGYGETDAR